MDDVKWLARALDIVASRCPRGLAAIVGEAPPPTYDDLVAAATWRPSVENGRSSGGGGEGPVPSLAERVMRVTGPLEKAGWKAIAAAGREVRELYPQDWEAYRLHVVYVDSPVQWRIEDDSTLQRLADKCRMDVRTLRRRRRQVPLQIARSALYGAQQGLDLFGL